MGLAPEERKSQGLLMLDTVAGNVSIASLRRYSRLGWLDRRREIADAEREVGGLDIRPRDPRRPVRTLSGGNQQKALLARWLLKDCCGCCCSTSRRAASTWEPAPSCTP